MFGKQNWRQPLSVCRFKTAPCVHSKRPRICRHHAHMLKHVCAWCRYTRGRGRFERTHGDVLSGHTGFFSVSHTTHHTTTQDTTYHNTTPTTRPQHHTEKEHRERTQRKKTEEEDRDRERRGDEREEERRFIFSVVVHGRS